MADSHETRYSDSFRGNRRRPHVALEPDLPPVEPTTRRNGRYHTDARPHNRRRNYQEHSPLTGPSSVQNGDPDDESDGSDDTISPQPRPGTRFRQTTTDWHGVICRFLNIGPESSDDIVFSALEEASAKLEDAERFTAFESHDLTPRYQTIHRVRCAIDGRTSIYLEEPFVVNSGPYNAHLRGSEPIYNFELYLERNKAVSFIAYKDYRCCESTRSRRRRNDDTRNLSPSALLTSESAFIVSPALRSALRELAFHALPEIPHPDFTAEEFSSPYLWWFSARPQISDALKYLNEYHQEQIGVFEGYLKQHLGETWAIVDAMLMEGKISWQFIRYLYVPNTILVANSDNESSGQQRAYLASSWLDIGSENPERAPASSSRARSNNFAGTVEGTYWTFDGNFEKATRLISINWLPSLTDPFNIRDLTLYPIEFAEPGLESLLRARGVMFWQCRFRNYVCYNGELNDSIQSGMDQRFMIDYATYKLMHPHDPKKNPQVPNEDDLGSDVMAREEPPDDDSFLLCLPNSIPGFNMNKKEWTNLDVSRLTPVKWNTGAFNSLVVEDETKELISALVTNKIDAEKSTDLMSGKGNGLFILLHGGPGTGKTLTAESVAEFSKKPLYRVTCGDIGTKAEEVEKYLDSVMLLGKTWGCVVLLDEADVFLEQRKISDLQRNALVSVSLRVLEYYDGILILTSNRVGTFDEAFKSRIQLILRYNNLDRDQRLKIWKNFIDRLEGFQSSPNKAPAPRKTTSAHGGVDLGVNVKEVREMLPQLANAALNGREIRNAISTARQLAMFRKEQMSYGHLNMVIEEAKKFEDYLSRLKHGFLSDDVMQAEGVR